MVNKENYEGNFKDDKREGYSEYHYPDGNYYNGT